MLKEEKDRERWLPVVGQEGFYEVSDLGRIRSLDRWVNYGGARSHRRFKRGVIHDPSPLASGHLATRFGKNTPRVFIHHVVLTAFVGPRPSGMEGCHGPSGPGDNRLTNLRWDTRSQNQRDITRHGGRFSAKLSLSDIVEIREALALGEARRDLATEFGVCRQMIDQIALRQTYFYA